MSILSVSLPEPLAERLAREADHRGVTQEVIVRQALEDLLPHDANTGEIAILRS